MMTPETAFYRLVNDFKENSSTQHRVKQNDNLYPALTVSFDKEHNPAFVTHNVIHRLRVVPFSLSLPCRDVKENPEKK